MASNDIKRQLNLPKPERRKRYNQFMNDMFFSSQEKDEYAVREIGNWVVVKYYSSEHQKWECRHHRKDWWKLFEKSGLKHN